MTTPVTSIVDTNLVLVANGQHQGVSLCCVAVCSLRLQAIMQQERIALDDSFRILNEYQHKTQPKRGNRPGDAFVWALRNNANSAKCDLVPLQEQPDRRFKSFPDDSDLVNFDAPDRMFVAVAAVHPAHPPHATFSRIKIPNILQHVIVRGIKKRGIFAGDDHRDDFVAGSGVTVA